jgi:hypothetical protein
MIRGHHNSRGVDQFLFLHLAEGIEVGVESAAEQARTNGVSERATFVGLVGEVCFIGAKSEGLSTA